LRRNVGEIFSGLRAISSDEMVRMAASTEIVGCLGRNETKWRQVPQSLCEEKGRHFDMWQMAFPSATPLPPFQIANAGLL
jgi:hypothetical protein